MEFVVRQKVIIAFSFEQDSVPEITIFLAGFISIKERI